jgi:hypothetical protein
VQHSVIMILQKNLPMRPPIYHRSVQLCRI